LIYVNVGPYGMQPFAAPCSRAHRHHKQFGSRPILSFPGVPPLDSPPSRLKSPLTSGNPKVQTISLYSYCYSFEYDAVCNAAIVE